MNVSSSRVARRVVLCLAVLLAVLVLPAPARAQQAAPSALQPALHKGPPAKYVIFFIGDGMGLAQRMAGDLYMDAMESKMPQAGVFRLAMNRLPAQGLATTFGADAVITESAAAGTALASGQKTVKGVLGLDATRKNPTTTLADLAKAGGRKVGVVSTASIDHATPAAFYAHVLRRGDYYGIARQLAASKVDFFAGGGFKQPKGKDGKKGDVMKEIEAAGFTVCRTAEEIAKLTPQSGRALAIHPSLDSEKSVVYEIDRKPEDPSLADLTAKALECLEGPEGFFLMVEGGKIDWACHANDAATAVRETLALDHAIQEAMKFYERHKDQTLIVVTADHETGGLSLGYSATGYKLHLERLANQKMSLGVLSKKVSDYRKTRKYETARFEELLGLLEEATGLAPETPEHKAAAAKALADLVAAEKALKNLTGQAREEAEDDLDDAKAEYAQLVGMVLNAGELEAMKRAFDASMRKLLPKPKTTAPDPAKYQPDLSYGGREPFAVEAVRILNRKAGINWGSYAHTAIPVPVSAIGVGQETFTGFYDNTHLQKKIAAAMGVAAGGR